MGLSSGIKIKVGAEKDCVQTVSVELPASRVKENLEKAFQSVRAQAKVPGFRPGKTPMDIIKQNYQETAFTRAQDSLLREGVTEAIKEKNIHAIQPPMVTDVKFHPEKPFQFEFQVEVAPTFKLSGHKGIKLTKKIESVSDDQVKEQMTQAAEANAQLVESKSETVANENFVNINYEASVDGKSVPNLKAENFLMDLSAPQAITGLTEGIVGSNVGEEKEIKVKFPDDSPAKDLAGKEAIFKVKILAIKDKKVPALDDEFAKDMGFQSVADFEKKIREKLERDLENKARKELENQVIDKLLEANTFKTPKAMVNKQVENLEKRHRYRLTQQGIPEAEQTKALDGLKNELTVQAEKDVRLAYVLNAVSDQEKLEVNEADIDKKIDDLVSKAPGPDKAKMKETLNKTYREQIGSELRDEKIFDWLISNGKVKETK